MVENRARIRLKYVLAFAWLLFTLTFAIWWMYFGLKQIRTLMELNPSHAEEFARYYRMMIWEGSAWMLLLLTGGCTLIWFVAREARRARELKEFFAAFSHDVKTSIASLRLQAESLKEDLGSTERPILDRLVGDTVRLNLQLQNSLFLASSEDLKFYLEDLRLSEMAQSLRHQWPQLDIRVDRDCIVRADERAMASVLANLTHNSVVHGDASRFVLNANPAGPDRVSIEFSDNGKGFQGDASKLATLFYRHSAGSGSGVGLYICRDLVKRMDGKLDLSPRPDGFSGRLELEGRLR
jgi:signal transduction histidine kinase